jgi:hypothetical protein
MGEASQAAEKDVAAPLPRHPARLPRHPAIAVIEPMAT